MTENNQDQMQDGQDQDQDQEEDKISKAEANRINEGSARGGHFQGGGSGVPIWLISFTDVMALMLTFFVLLFAMTEPHKETWIDFSSALQKEFNRFYGPRFEQSPEDAINLDRIDYNIALNLNYLQALITRLLEDEEDLETVSLMVQPGQLIVSLPEDLLFETARAEVSDHGADVLFSLSGVLSRIRNRIEVMGHSDPRPIRGTYPSNWELSLSRANAVAAALETYGYRRPVMTRGLSSGRYDELPDSLSVQEKMDLSRRVDIVIMEDSGTRPALFSVFD